MAEKLGRQTIVLNNPPHIKGFFSTVGKKENNGPLGGSFDSVYQDEMFGAKSWEEAENTLIKNTVAGAMTRASVTSDEIDYMFCGDLLNQCTGSSFGISDLGIPFFGLYGACSTMIESLSLASVFIELGAANYTVAATSSHFCSSEKQFRFPLEYGSVRTPTSQWTVTGSGAIVLSQKSAGPCITRITTGKMVDLGVTDANNMGAAMAPAAADCIHTHFKETGLDPSYYDVIITGDLATVGTTLLYEILNKSDFNITKNHKDCGLMIFDPESQNTKAGGSGCGCIASVLCGYFLPRMLKKELNKILVVATGAMMSPTTAQLGKPIIGIAHAVSIENL